MTNWKQGYVADVEYISGFYPNHAPAHIDLICLLNGVARPKPAQDFTWCELGCGQGATANLLAAAHPDAAFHGIDFLPAHIDAARAVAEAAGLANIHFHETDFAAAAEDDGLPSFDYIVAHGVYTWVGRDAQRAILRFLDRRLKPGGVVLLSYNTVPGWARVAPLQKLLLAYAGAHKGGSISAVREALDFAGRLQSVGAAGLDGIDLANFTGALPGRSIAERDAYLAHEYLNVHWRPLLHSDVAHDLGSAGLSYAGSARMYQNMKELVLSDGQRAVLEGVADPVLRESLADYCGQPPFRIDIFARDASRLSAREADGRLRQLLLGLAGSLALPATIQGPDHSLDMKESVYRPIQDALRDRILSIGELLALPGVAGRSDLPSPRELAIALVGSQQVLPTRVRTPVQSPALSRLNRAQVEKALRQGNAVAALAAGAGGGVLLTALDAAVYRELTDQNFAGEAVVLERVQRQLHGSPMQAGGDPVSLAADASGRFATAQATHHALRTMPAMLRRLGIG